MNVNEQYQELLDAAFAAMQHAYAPYSRYHVGACVKTKDGTLIPGRNSRECFLRSDELCRAKCDICRLFYGLSQGGYRSDCHCE